MEIKINELYGIFKNTLNYEHFEKIVNGLMDTTKSGHSEMEDNRMIYFKVTKPYSCRLTPNAYLRDKVNGKWYFNQQTFQIITDAKRRIHYWIAPFAKGIHLFMNTEQKDYGEENAEAANFLFVLLYCLLAPYGLALINDWFEQIGIDDMTKTLSFDNAIMSCLKLSEDTAYVLLSIGDDSLINDPDKEVLRMVQEKEYKKITEGLPEGYVGHIMTDRSYVDDLKKMYLEIKPGADSYVKDEDRVQRPDVPLTIPTVDEEIEANGFDLNRDEISNARTNNGSDNGDDGSNPLDDVIDKIDIESDIEDMPIDLIIENYGNDWYEKCLELMFFIDRVDKPLSSSVALPLLDDLFDMYRIKKDIVIDYSQTFDVQVNYTEPAPRSNVHQFSITDWFSQLIGNMCYSLELIKQFETFYYLWLQKKAVLTKRGIFYIITNDSILQRDDLFEVENGVLINNPNGQCGGILRAMFSGVIASNEQSYDDITRFSLLAKLVNQSSADFDPMTSQIRITLPKSSAIFDNIDTDLHPASAQFYKYYYSTTNINKQRLARTTSLLVTVNMIQTFLRSVPWFEVFWNTSVGINSDQFNDLEEFLLVNLMFMYGDCEYSDNLGSVRKSIYPLSKWNVIRATGLGRLRRIFDIVFVTWKLLVDDIDV